LKKIFLKEESLWATLAGLALAEKSFTIAEICYGQLKEVCSKRKS